MWRIASLFWLLVAFGVKDAYSLKGRRWNIWTHTPNIENADTDASVYIILIAPDDRQSPPILLDNWLWNDFQLNYVDHFDVDDQVNIMEVCAIRIYHDNGGLSPGLFLQKVTMKRATQRRHRIFNINRWVPTEQEDRTSPRVIRHSPPCSEVISVDPQG